MLVWVVAAILVASLFYTRSTKLELPAIAEVDEHVISSPGVGLLYNLPVKLHQEVIEGQTVAIVNIYTNPTDAARINFEKATAETEVQRLRSELAAVEEQFKSEAAQQEFRYIDTLRQLAVDVERARIAELEVRTTLEPDEILLKSYETDIQITQDLLAKGAVEKYELQQLQAQYDALAKKIEISKVQLTNAEKNRTNAEERQKVFAQNKPAPVIIGILLDPIRKQILEQEQRIASLMKDQEMKFLIAPCDGVVSNILRQERETVLEGEPILTLAKRKPKDILAFAGVSFTSAAKEKMKVQVIKRSYPHTVYESQVLSVGPTIEKIPTRLWQSPTFPEFGRPIVIEYKNGMDLIPNEMVWVRGLY